MCGKLQISCLEVPWNHRLNECDTRPLEARSKHIMHLRTHAIMEILSVGSSRNTFSTFWWHRCFSMRWKYRAVTSLSQLGKSLKMSKNIFLQNFYNLRNKRHRCTLSIAMFIEHSRVSIFSFTCITWNVIFWSHRSYLTSENDNRIYLSLSLYVNTRKVYLRTKTT